MLEEIWGHILFEFAQTVFNRYVLGTQNIDLRGLKSYAAIDSRWQIEFKIFFCFMDRDFIAWFDLN